MQVENIESGIIDHAREALEELGLVLEVRQYQPDPEWYSYDSFIVRNEETNSSPLNFKCQAFPGACGMRLMFGYRACIEIDERVLSIIRDLLVSFYGDSAGYHRIIFSSSDQEFVYTKDHLEIMGFEEIEGGDFVSVRTYHQCRLWQLTVASEEAINNAIRYYNQVHNAAANVYAA